MNSQRPILNAATVLNDQILERASPAARLFRALFGDQLGYLRHTEEFTDRYELVIPAPHPELGELRVRDDGDELTVSIGPHHWHNSLHLFDEEPELRRSELVAEVTVEDIRRVVQGRTVIRVGRGSGSTKSYDLGATDVKPPSPDEIDYVWTGPL